MTAPNERIDNELRGEIEEYLVEAMTSIRRRAEAVSRTVPAADEAVFDLVTSRRFCYLGRKRTAPYRDATLELVRRDMESGEPVRFYYDIGPGYHASTHPGETDLVFDVGLSELLQIRQAVDFCNGVSELYPAGARFFLVIDNFCALATNDIPVGRTSGYVERLRSLISEVGAGDRVEPLVESEAFELSEYENMFEGVDAQAPSGNPSAADIENVVRFLGHSCSGEEAADRIERYRRAGIVTEALLERVVRGVRMTQRATGATLGFRPFPGGDQRTQCGEVALTRRSKGGVKPVLLTSRNVDAFDCVDVELPGVLPPSVPRITWADPRPA